MKKFLVAILAFVYISTEIGVNINMHYCMGKLAGWGIGQPKSKTYSKCGMVKSEKKDKGCCKDKHQTLKSDTDQKLSESAFQLKQQLPVSLPFSFTESPSTILAYVNEDRQINHGPPLNHDIPIYILCCDYRI